MDRAKRTGVAIIGIGKEKDGKGLVTLPARRSPSLLEEIKYQEVAIYMPASSAELR